ncbi:hypothetical protein [Chelativorans salis]|uniref:Uncharacterized protein n=1 Tax=Chelativorans salis TaxID=2978478 RepID=A0ABT2LXL4_9HYPH|nr:hypothetical protein [Chelativorans sp. EGI FJ00035]MCT7378123.1 hypothetical protein [Chelativorans sp. EGI FJ00035]
MRSTCTDVLQPAYDLTSAQPGTFAIEPVAGMVAVLKDDYANTTAMIFGAAPEFDDVLASAKTIEHHLNEVATRHVQGEGDAGKES